MSGAPSGREGPPPASHAPDPARERDAAALFERIEPELAAHEQAVRDGAPGLSDDQIRDQALRRAVAQLRHELSEQTFVYLRWRAQEAAAAAAATRAAAVEGREASASARARRLAEWEAHVPAPLAGRDAPRTFVDGDGQQWTVHEVATGDVAWARAPRCLLFSSAEAIRRVWHFPENWRTLPDAELATLSWGT